MTDFRTRIATNVDIVEDDDLQERYRYLHGVLLGDDDPNQDILDFIKDECLGDVSILQHAFNSIDMETTTCLSIMDADAAIDATVFILNELFFGIDTAGIIIPYSCTGSKLELDGESGGAIYGAGDGFVNTSIEELCTRWIPRPRASKELNFNVTLDNVDARMFTLRDEIMASEIKYMLDCIYDNSFKEKVHWPTREVTAYKREFDLNARIFSEVYNSINICKGILYFDITEPNLYALLVTLRCFKDVLKQRPTVVLQLNASDVITYSAVTMTEMKLS